MRGNDSTRESLFNRICPDRGRAGIPREKLMRALLLQVMRPVCRERQLAALAVG